MNSYMVPVNDEFIEMVAKAIAKNRLFEDATGTIRDMVGGSLEDSPRLNQSFDMIFERLWAGDSPHDELQKSMYRSDARAAISAINLKILIGD